MTEASTGVVIRKVADDGDLHELIHVINAVTPEDPTSLDEIRWADATYPGGARFVAVLDGRVVGAATVGRVYVFPESHPYHWASIVVEPGARRQGIGSRLLDAVSRHAEGAGKIGLEMRATTDRPEGIAFLEHRGFRELERARMVRLSLADRERPDVTMPDGVRLTTLADEPDRVTGVHAVAVDAFPDIPGGDTPMAVGDLAEFRARDVDRAGIPADGFFVAVDETTEAVVGYASLMFLPGSTTRAWHDMTAVRRSARGRGIALALKQATIAWAIDHGLTALETGNDDGNAPMRAVNARLGYQPMPDELGMRGPLYRYGGGTARGDRAS